MVSNLPCSRLSLTSHHIAAASSCSQPQAPFTGALRLWILYQTWIGQLLLLLPITWWILTWQHHRIAKYAESPRSKKSIKPFIKVISTPVLKQT